MVNVIATSQSGVVRTFGRSMGSQLSGISPRLGPGGTRPSGLGSSSHQGAKPNVIVVHKAQVWPQSQAGHASGLGSSLGTMHAGKSTVGSLLCVSFRLKRGFSDELVRATKRATLWSSDLGRLDD